MAALCKISRALELTAFFSPDLQTIFELLIPLQVMALTQFYLNTFKKLTAL